MRFRLHSSRRKEMKFLNDMFIDNTKLEENDQTTIVRTCRGCDEVIEPHSWYYVGMDYASGSERLLHKFCGELPLEMSHPVHPQHLLKLNFVSQFRPPFCDLCSRIDGDRWMYRCDLCQFNVDLVCAQDETFKLLSSKNQAERERVTLKDLTHNHQLKLLHIQIRQDDDDDNDDEDDGDRDLAIIQECKACLQPMIDSSYYICTEESEGCKDYFLHRFCAELPVQIKHTLHPLHNLMLMLSPPLKHFKCFACGNFCEGITYSCRACSYHLHIRCATAASRVLEHKCHEHPLTLLSMANSSLFCSACCNVHEGMFYQCNTCMVYFIHQDCASLGYVIFHRSHNGHPLRLAFPSNGTHIRNDCDICCQRIYARSGWFYYCKECKFYGHLNCIRSDKDLEVREIDHDIPCLPWEETVNEFGIVSLLNRNLVTTQNDFDKEMDVINHFSHPQHPLILHTDVPREANPYSDGEITLATQCNGCCKQISAPLYSCASCHFYIHKGCALLPDSLPQHQAHSQHDHSRLVLQIEPWRETRVFECSECDGWCNGFSYRCGEKLCYYEIDLECAFLPIEIVHKSHPFHPLRLVNLDMDKSRLQNNIVRCCTYDNHKYVYGCDTCSFQIHTRCAMYPAKAHHRFDCQSPFTLCYDPGQIEPNEFHYCDICEKTLDPKKWFFFSNKNGGQIMHPLCLFLRYKAAVDHPNFKSTSSLLEVDIHPHPLHFYPTYINLRCYHCKHTMSHHDSPAGNVPKYFDFAYQCAEWDCKYQIQFRCLDKIKTRAVEDFGGAVDKVMDAAKEEYGVLEDKDIEDDEDTVEVVILLEEDDEDIEEDGNEDEDEDEDEVEVKVEVEEKVHDNGEDDDDHHHHWRN